MWTTKDILWNLLKYVHAIAGSFFWNRTEGKRNFDDDEIEHFQLNVVDTPGFGDTDKDWFDSLFIDYTE